MNLRVILEPSEEGGYTAIVPSLPGCLSEGDTREEALKNIREAIELYLEPVEDDSSFAVDSEQLERMSKVPSLNYTRLINALRRDGWIVILLKQ